MKDDRLYLIHILECRSRIESYTGSGKRGFHTDQKTQDAVMRNLQIIGECVRRLSPGTTDRYPAVPWSRIVGFRNVLVHDYLGIRLDLVWEVVETFLPELKSEIRLLLDDLGGAPAHDSSY